MPSLDETLNGGPLHDALLAGIADISQRQTICFTTYTKTILPLDGFVFWLRQSSFEATGALHWMTERQQNEDETSTQNSIVFTTDTQVQPLNQSNTQTLVVGVVEGRRSFAFARTGWFFEPAGIWHYQGESLDPATATQLIDDPSKLDPTQLIVSDSLPAWLALATFMPEGLVPLNPAIPLYPSYLVPDNIEPPWGAVHIEPEGIRPLQPIPLLDRNATHTQLTAERVRVTLYGCNNSVAADFLDTVISYSYYTDVIGIMGAGPTIRDDKRRWVAGMTLAQKKLIDFEVSYFQTRINDIARQLILDAQCAVMTEWILRPKVCVEGAATITVTAT